MNTFTFPIDAHTPFTAEDGTHFCCLPLAGAWKIHAWRDSAWKQLATGQSAQTSEIAPCAEKKHGIWRISFIGEKPDSLHSYLYRVLSNGGELPFDEYGIWDVSTVARATAGFVSEFITAYNLDGNAVQLLKGKEEVLRLECHDIANYTQISYRPKDSHILILTGALRDGKSFHRSFDLQKCELRDLAEDIPLPPGLFSFGECPKCRYAEDTRKRAFVNIPCRGNAIICRRDGHLTYANQCTSENCRQFEN